MELSPVEPRRSSEHERSEGQSQGRDADQMTHADPTEDGPMLPEEGESGEHQEEQAVGDPQQEQNRGGEEEPDVLVHRRDPPLSEENRAEATETADDSDGESGRDKVRINRFNILWLISKFAQAFTMSSKR